MLAASHHAKAKLGLVQRQIGKNQHDHGNQHKPIELKTVETDQKRFSRLNILNGRRHVGGILRGVNCLYNDGGGSKPEHVQRGTDDGLVSLEVDAGHGQEAGEQNAQSNRAKEGEENDKNSRGACRKIFHHEGTAESTENHNAFQTDVDHTGMLRKTSSQSNQEQHRRKNQRVLKQQQ